MAGRSHAVSADRHERTATPAERETLQRAHSARVVIDAIESGAWPIEAETFDSTASLLAAAARWALVAELGAA
jgi:hypothetical protein